MFKKRKYLPQQILILISLFSSIIFKTYAQTDWRPKIVLGITIEGLSEDYLSLLSPLFAEDGFKRMVNNGMTFTNVDFGPNIDQASATAMIYTGAAPSINGISSNDKYDKKNKRINHILIDTVTSGTVLKPILSPKSIAVSTIADEIRLDASGTGWIYSIAPNATQAIISTGHAGNNAYWIDDNTGQWMSSSYYKDVALPMSNVNFKRPLTVVMDTISWTPLISPEKYPFIPDYKIKYPFRYSFTKKNEDRVLHFKNSPLVNTEIANLACEFINNMKFGERGPIDMLNLTFTVAPYLYSSNPDNRMELIDSYLRTDRAIASILNTLNKKIGLDHVLVFIAGYPAVGTNQRDDEKWGIPTGDFSPKKAISLLNIYLMALYGNGNWVEGYHNRNFYLNSTLIKERQLDITDVRNEVAIFLSKMSGVAEAMTIDEIVAYRAGENPAAFKRNISMKNAGDVIISITPGWAVVDDINGAAANSKRLVYRNNSMPSVFMILAPTVKPSKNSDVIDARSIAPTISRLAKFRPPNGASLSPLIIED